MRYWFQVAFLLAATIMLAGCLEDSLSSRASSAEVRNVVASELCPLAPELVEDELITAEDSGAWIVYVRSGDEIKSAEDIRGESDYVAQFGVTGGDRAIFSGPLDQRSDQYLAETRMDCEDGRLDDLKDYQHFSLTWN